MPLDPKMIENLFAPGTKVRMSVRPLKGTPRPRAWGRSRGGREYYGRTVRQWLRLLALCDGVSDVKSTLKWEVRLRWHFDKRQGKPEQFLTHARQKGWIK